MDKAKTVTASFVSYKLTVTKAGTGAKGGTVSSATDGIDCGTDCKEGYPPGTTVTLTATYDSSTTFTGWSVKSCGTADTCTVTMDKATAVTATFKKKTGMALFDKYSYLPIVEALHGHIMTARSYREISSIPRDTTGIRI